MSLFQEQQSGDGLSQLHSSDQVLSELQAEAEASHLVNRKEELDGCSLDKSALHG